MFSIFILFLQLASSPAELRADFNQNTGTIEGKLLIKNIQRRTNLYFTYPNKYRNKAPYYNDLTRFKLYPSHFNQGYLRINEIYYNQRKLNFSWVRINWIKRGAVKITIPPTLKLNGQLEIHFTTAIPKKFGLFGCIKGRCWLGAPWYPIPVPLINGKYETTSPPLPWKHKVKVTANKNLQLFLEKPAKGKVENSGRVTFFPLITGNNFKQYCFGKFCLYHYSPLHSFWNIFSGIKINQVLTFLKRETQIESTRKIWLLETPLRQNIALPVQNNKIFLAHKIFQIIPTQYMLDFHRQSLLKAVYELVFRQKLSSLENNKDLVWLSGLLARHRLGKRKNVASFLSKFEFIPQIDVIIKNPRMEFSNSFFSGPGNKDLFRESALKWNNHLPQGNRIYNKLLDLLGKVELENFLKSYLENNKPFRNYLNEYTSRDHSWFFRQWLGKYPEVNYFLKKLKKLKKHRGFYFYKLVVGKETEILFKEPVEIRVTA
ncbi:MAG: hypothetical protein PF689_11980, partial [Deltaproteobacteria bacterium]|nr:hypothetical protein [Deltaproteobacteria bacterium]